MQVSEWKAISSIEVNCTHDNSIELSVMLLTAGPGHTIAITIFQFVNLVLSSIGYTVAAGQSLR